MRWRRAIRDAYGFVPDKWERERFLRDVSIEGCCWVWRGNAQWHDLNGKRYNPQRLAYLMLKGGLDEKERVGSTCGKQCCLPDHMVTFL